MTSEIESLRQQINVTEAQLASLKKQLASLEQKTAVAEETKDWHNSNGEGAEGKGRKWPLSLEEYKRYGRQMIVPQVGIQGQLKLRSSSVLLVGAGGLGCPAALYLAGAGMGTIGLVDGDTVEPSNLHRQVLHSSETVGKYKVDSAIQYLQGLNPHPKYVPYRSHLTPEEAPAIFAKYDVILDCTDNPASRYLISDTAVLLGKPLVSASALRTEGQLMVLNNPPRPPGDTTGGPCYRCVFPNPPPADGIVTCADGGILGPVVGTMGVMQALQAIKVITTSHIVESTADMNGSSSSNTPSEPHYLHLFSAYSAPPFRAIRLRPRRKACASCSSEATITVDSLKSGSTDYVLFCGSASSPNVLSSAERIAPSEYRKLYHESKTSTNPPTIIDVREKVQFDICSLENSINIPISAILSSAHQPQSKEGGSESEKNENSSVEVSPSWLPPEISSSTSDSPIYVVCRLGNDSQIAVQKLKERGLDRGGQRPVYDIRGGFRAWKQEVDPDWPEY